MKDQELERVKEFGEQVIEGKSGKPTIEMINIIGEIEGHECLPQATKTTKYEHILPMLASVECRDDIEGLLVLINTVGGDVESGLAIAEMIASIGKPTVGLVLGGSHSIGGPLAVATDYTFIVPTATMIIHPVRLSGTVIGAKATYEYFQMIEERIAGFIEEHSNAQKEDVKKMMVHTGTFTKDLGTLLVGKDAVREGIVNEVGGIHEAVAKLYELIEEKEEKQS